MTSNAAPENHGHDREPPVVPLEYDGQEDSPASTPMPGQKWFGQSLSKTRFLGAFAVAAASDMLSFAFAFAPPVQWVVDMSTALVLFAMLGWRWILLPALVLEAIPGLAAFPVWVLVVSAISAWGTPRPTSRSADPQASAPPKPVGER